MRATAVDGAETVWTFPGAVPDAVAVFETEPLVASSLVAVYVAVKTVLSPGASVVVPDGETAPIVPVPVNAPSATPTPVTVTLPVLVTVKRYEI